MFRCQSLCQTIDYQFRQTKFEVILAERIYNSAATITSKPYKNVRHFLVLKLTLSHLVTSKSRANALTGH